MKCHPLTELICNKVINLKWKNDVLIELTDNIIRDWLKEKSHKIWVYGLNHNDIGKKSIHSILEISEPTLEDKFIKELSGKAIPITNNEYYLDQQLGMLAKIAEEHYKNKS